jgi:hypothetical protein
MYRSLKNYQTVSSSYPAIRLLNDISINKKALGILFSVIRPTAKALRPDVQPKFI